MFSEIRPLIERFKSWVFVYEYLFFRSLRKLSLNWKMIRNQFSAILDFSSLSYIDQDLIEEFIQHCLKVTYCSSWVVLGIGHHGVAGGERVAQHRYLKFETTSDPTCSLTKPIIFWYSRMTGSIKAILQTNVLPVRIVVVHTQCAFQTVNNASANMEVVLHIFKSDWPIYWSGWTRPKHISKFILRHLSPPPQEFLIGRRGGHSRGSTLSLDVPS